MKVAARAIIHTDVAHNDVTACDMQMAVVMARHGRLLLYVYTRRIRSTFVKKTMKITPGSELNVNIRNEVHPVKRYTGIAKLTLVVAFCMTLSYVIQCDHARQCSHIRVSFHWVNFIL
jgi:hypothetical protein